MTKVFVTGGSGFIGRHIARYLAEQGSYSVIAGVHKTQTGLPVGDQITPKTIDVRNVKQMEEAFAGVDAVVHCARGERQVSVNGTQTVLNAARAANVRRVIYISCSNIYGLAKGDVSEDTPPVFSESNEDADQQAECESLCRAASDAGLSVVILRATTVIGPEGMSTWLKDITKWLFERRWGIVERLGDGTCNIVDARDLARAVELSITSDKASGQVYNVNGPETMTWNGFFERLNVAMDFPPVRKIKGGAVAARVFRSGAFRTASKLMPFARPVLRKQLWGAPTYHEIDLYRTKAVYLTDKAKADFGWSPSIPLAQAIADSAAWAKANEEVWND